MCQAERLDVGPLDAFFFERGFEGLEAVFRSDAGVDQQITFVESNQIDVDRFEFPRHRERYGVETGNRRVHAIASAA